MVTSKLAVNNINATRRGGCNTGNFGEQAAPVRAFHLNGTQPYHVRSRHEQHVREVCERLSAKRK